MQPGHSHTHSVLHMCSTCSWGHDCLAWQGLWGPGALRFRVSAARPRQQHGRPRYTFASSTHQVQRCPGSVQLPFACCLSSACWSHCNKDVCIYVLQAHGRGALKLGLLQKI